MANAGTVTITLDANTAKLVQGIKRSQRDVQSLTKTVDSVKRSFKSFGDIARISLAGLGAREISRLADSFTNISNRIRLVTDSEKELIDTRRKLLVLSNNARVDLEDTADLYRRIKQSTEELNYSQKDMLSVTDAISKSITISGGSAESAKAALLQLSQGFASGTLRGQELNSVMEQAPRLARAIADGMGIAYGDLRRVAEQGGLTTEKVIEAIRKEGSIINEEFSKVSASISGSFTALKNSSVELIGTIDNQLGVSKTLTSSIIATSRAIVENKAAIVSVAKQIAILGASVASVKLGAFSVDAVRSSTTLQLLRSGSIGASIALHRIGVAIKGIVATNLPLLAIVAAFEAWNYVTGKEADEQERLNSILNENYSILSKMKKIEAIDKINFLKDRLVSVREETQELYTQVKIEEGRNHERTKSSVSIRAEIEHNKEIIKQINDQIDSLSHVVDGTYDAEHGFTAAASAADGVSSAVNGINSELKKTISNAFSLAQTIIDIDSEKGIIGGKEAAKKSYELAKERASLIEDPLKRELELKKAELGYTIEIKRIEDQIKRDKERSSAISHSSAMAAKRAAEKALSIRREYYSLIGNKKEVFSIDATKKLKEMMKSGLFSKEEMSKAYDAMWNDFTKKGEEAAKSVADRIQDAFGIKNDSVFGHLFDNMLNGFSSLSDAFKSGSDMNVADAFGEMRLKALDAVIPGLGEAVGTITSMFGSKLTEAEIKAAAGRTEFESKGTAQIVETLKKYQDPQLTATRQMLTHLESMDNNLLAALASSASLDLSGANYTPKSSSVLGGFISASTTELIGSGIKFYDQAVAGFVEGVNADKYQAIKKSSSFLGIFHSEKIKETASELPPKIAKQLGAAFKDGIDAASTALDTLGLNTDAIQQKINDYVVSIGKVNLKDLSPEEQAKAINAALTEQLNNAVSGAINSIASPENIAKLNSLQLAGEEYVQSLVRIATEFETVKKEFAYFGQAIDDFATADRLVQLAGGLSQWKSAQEEFRSMLSSGEQREYMKQQLQYALSVYHVALPASKAQFIALKKETEAKIISIRATINTLKAEIAAKVAAGKMSLAAAYGELNAKGQIAQAQANVIKGQVSANNYLIDSSHNAGRAAVGFGKSIHSSIQAMAGRAAEAAVDGAKTAVDAAGNIDYSRITSPAIQAAEAELSNLEGLYGTLMSNMGQFADYYNDSANGVADATNKAAEAMSDLQKRLLEIANLRAEWTGDNLEAAKIKLKATEEYTKLYGLTYDNFLKKFNEAVAKGIDDKELEKWKQMSSAIKEYHSAVENLNKGLNDFKLGARNAFRELFNTTQAQAYGSLERAINNRDYNGAMSAYKRSLEFAKTSSTTREEYFLKAARLNDRIRRIEPKNPNAGVEKRLDEINKELHKLREEQYLLNSRVARNTDKPIISEAV